MSSEGWEESAGRDDSSPVMFLAVFVDNLLEHEVVTVWQLFDHSIFRPMAEVVVDGLVAAAGKSSLWSTTSP